MDKRAEQRVLATEWKWNMRTVVDSNYQTHEMDSVSDPSVFGGLRDYDASPSP